MIVHIVVVICMSHKACNNTLHFTSNKVRRMLWPCSTLCVMQMWDYVLLEGPEPQGSNISKQLLQTMRREFNYWYPYDLRVSSDMHISSCNISTLCAQTWLPITKPWLACMLPVCLLSSNGRTERITPFNTCLLLLSFMWINSWQMSW